MTLYRDPRAAETLTYQVEDLSDLHSYLIGTLSADLLTIHGGVKRAEKIAEIFHVAIQANLEGRVNDEAFLPLLANKRVCIHSIWRGGLLSETDDEASGFIRPVSR